MYDDKFNSIIGELVSRCAKGAKKATKYISPKYVIKSTFQGKRHKRERTETFIITVGRPNYREREYIKKLVKVSEPFPVKKLQLQWTHK